MMMNSGHGNRRGMDAKIRGQQFVRRGEDRNPVLLGHLGGTRGIGLKGGHQFDTLARFLQLAQDPKMIAAKGACPGHSYPQNGFARDDYASLPSTAFRQRL